VTLPPPPKMINRCFGAFISFFPFFFFLTTSAAHLLNCRGSGYQLPNPLFCDVRDVPFCFSPEKFRLPLCTNSLFPSEDPPPFQCQTVIPSDGEFPKTPFLPPPLNRRKPASREMLFVVRMVPPSRSDPFLKGLTLVPSPPQAPTRG